MMRSIIRRICVAAVAVAITVSVYATSSNVRVAEAFPSGSQTTLHEGFDKCSPPSESQFATWWSYSPYWWHGLYIGGENWTCRPLTFTAQNLNDVYAQGWRFMFLWVGPQPPCTTMGKYYTFSSNTTTAYSQGTTEAHSAIATLSSTLGVDNQASGSAIAYDIESAGNGTCQAATNSFIQGWVNYMHQCCPTQVPGVYGSVCGASLDSYAFLSPPPTFVWGAEIDGNHNTDTGDLWYDPSNCGVASDHWVDHQRLKQWNQSHYETYPAGTGVKLYIDSDCANGPTNPTTLSGAQCT